MSFYVTVLYTRSNFFNTHVGLLFQYFIHLWNRIRTPFMDIYLHRKFSFSEPCPDVKQKKSSLANRFLFILYMPNQSWIDFIVTSWTDKAYFSWNTICEGEKSTLSSVHNQNQAQMNFSFRQMINYLIFIYIPVSLQYKSNLKEQSTNQNQVWKEKGLTPSFGSCLCL